MAKKKKKRSRKSSPRKLKDHRGPMKGSVTEKVVQLIDSGKFTSVTEVAEKLGVGKQAVSNAMSRWRNGSRERLNEEAAEQRKKRRQPRRGTAAYEIQRRYYKGGLRNFSELAIDLGVSRQYVLQVLKNQCGYAPSPRRSLPLQRSARRRKAQRRKASAARA